ncbi:hypothetical protein M0R01_01700 [bacterium]|nr:hypothetical protein [bacterium]
MKKEEVSQAWFLQTINGKSFLIITKRSGTWASLFAAIECKDSFCGINITEVNGNLDSLFEMITEDDVVTFENQKWERSFYSEFYGEINTLQSYTIKFADEIVESKNIRFLNEVYDRF